MPSRWDSEVKEGEELVLVTDISSLKGLELLKT